MTTVEPAESLSDHISAHYRTRPCWNPVSAAGLDAVAGLLDLGRAGTLLDIGCGTGALACDWAARFSLAVTGVDLSPTFVRRAVERAEEEGVADSVSFEAADARSLRPGSARYDRVVAFGVAGVLGGFVETVERAAGLTVPGGVFAVGDQLPHLAEQLARIDGGDRHRLVGVVRSSRSDWDSYYTDQWQAVFAWAAAEPGHPAVAGRLDAVRRHQVRYLAGDTPDLEWGVLAFTRLRP